MVTFELPAAPAPTHKTSGITKPELAAMLTDQEKSVLDKARILLDVDMSWHPFDLDQDAAAIGRAGETFKDVLRSSFERYKDAPDFDVNHPDFIKGWQLHAAIGFIAPERIPTIMLGFPLR